MGLLENWAVGRNSTLPSARSPWETTALHETHSGNATLIGVYEASQTQDFCFKVTTLRWSWFPLAQLQSENHRQLSCSFPERGSRPSGEGEEAGKRTKCRVNLQELGRARPQQLFQPSQALRPCLMSGS